MGKDIKSYDPFEKMFGIREDFDSMLKDFFRDFGTSSSRPGVFPLMDVREDSEKYTVAVEVPGMTRDDINLSIQDDQLVVEGEKKEEEKEEDESYLRVERSYGRFRRRLRLPGDVDQEKVDAKYKDGVLNIHLPKTEEKKPKEIEVEIE